MDKGHNHGLLSHTIPTMENSDSIILYFVDRASRYNSC